MHMDTITTGLSVVAKALNFKHRTTLFVYTNTSLTSKDDERIENEVQQQ